MPRIRLVFVGHDFFGRDLRRKQAYRQSIVQAVTDANADPRVTKKGWQYQVIFGDTSFRENRELQQRCSGLPPSKGYYWIEIPRRILKSDFSLFDLTNRRFKRFVNANVLLECGFALRARRTYRVIGTNRKTILKHLSNLAGMDIGEYKDDAKFTGLAELIKEFLILQALT